METKAFDRSDRSFLLRPWTIVCETNRMRSGQEFPTIAWMSRTETFAPKLKLNLVVPKNPCAQPQCELQCNRGSQHKASSTASQPRNHQRQSKSSCNAGLQETDFRPMNPKVLRGATRTLCVLLLRQTGGAWPRPGFLESMAVHLRYQNQDAGGTKAVRSPLNDKSCSTTLEIQPLKTSMG